MEHLPARTSDLRATLLLIAACTGVWGLLVLLGPEAEFLASLHAGLIPGYLTNAALNANIGNWGWYTLITSMFLHASFSHLATNMLMLLILGRGVEKVLGFQWLLILYFVSGLVGGLFQTWSDTTSQIPVIGASGAIAGLFGAYAMLFSRTRVAGRSVLGFYVPGAVLRTLWILAAWLVLQAMLVILSGLDGTQIAIWAHIGGFVAGLVLAVPFARIVVAQRHAGR